MRSSIVFVALCKSVNPGLYICNAGAHPHPMGQKTMVSKWPADQVWMDFETMTPRQVGVGAA